MFHAYFLFLCGVAVLSVVLIAIYVATEIRERR